VVEIESNVKLDQKSYSSTSSIMSLVSLRDPSFMSEEELKAAFFKIDFKRLQKWKLQQFTRRLEHLSYIADNGVVDQHERALIDLPEASPIKINN